MTTRRTASMPKEPRRAQAVTIGNTTDGTRPIGSRRCQRFGGLHQRQPLHGRGGRNADPNQGQDAVSRRIQVRDLTPISTARRPASGDHSAQVQYHHRLNEFPLTAPLKVKAGT